MATPLSAVCTILSLTLLRSASALISALFRLGLGACALLNKLFLSALSSLHPPL